MTGAAPREIGSDFDSYSALTVATRREGSLPGLDRETPSVFVESGRQALSLVAEAAAAVGLTDLLFPTYYCESMIQPFLAHNFRICWTPVTSGWQLDPPHDDLRDPSRTLIYSMPFFGVPENSAWQEFLRAVRAQGAKTLSDETHRLFGPRLADSDWTAASLRKLLPVPDGAYATGSFALPTRIGDQGEMRWRAMEAKATHLFTAGSGQNGPATKAYREGFARAEASTFINVAPAAISRRSARLVASLDYELIAARRRENARYFEDGFRSRLFTLSTAGVDLPSHHVLTGGATALRNLREHLTANRVFAPVHWPRPEGHDGPWRAALSIPLDHRYTPVDMSRILELMDDFERGHTAC